MSIETARHTCYELDSQMMDGWMRHRCGACECVFTIMRRGPDYCPNCGMQFERYEYYNGEADGKSA